MFPLRGEDNLEIVEDTQQIDIKHEPQVGEQISIQGCRGQHCFENLLIYYVSIWGIRPAICIFIDIRLQELSEVQKQALETYSFDAPTYSSAYASYNRAGEFPTATGFKNLPISEFEVIKKLLLRMSILIFQSAALLTQFM